MKYLKLNTGLCPKTPWWYSLLKRIIPQANPDLEKYYFQVQFWWLETDDNGVAKREIGFDSGGKPIVLGPIGKNYGCLVDSPRQWNFTEYYSEEAKQKFDEIWEILYKKFLNLEFRD